MTTELADARDMDVVHTMYLRELANAPALVRAVEAGDTARATVIADHITLMSLLLTMHHTGEDKHVWPNPDHSRRLVAGVGWLPRGVVDLDFRGGV